MSVVHNGFQRKFRFLYSQRGCERIGKSFTSHRLCKRTPRTFPGLLYKCFVGSFPHHTQFFVISTRMDSTVSVHDCAHFVIYFAKYSGHLRVIQCLVSFSDFSLFITAVTITLNFTSLFYVFATFATIL